METKTAPKGIWKHIVCCIIILIIFILTVGSSIDAKGLSSDSEIPIQTDVSKLVVDLDYKVNSDEVEFSGPQEIVTVEYDEFDIILTSYADELEFFADTFGVKYDLIIDDLNKRRAAYTDEEFEETNIGFLLDSKGNIKTYSSIEYGIVEYFYDYVEKNPKNVSNKRVPCTDSAKYIKNLIIYYTKHIYTNVDTATAISIASCESGNFKAKGMLKANNINGTMSSGKLVRYKNIEYGVLSYIRLLSKNYYGKGLDTVAKIGKKYNPVYDSNGNKVASPTWVKNVNMYLSKYKNKTLEATIEDLIS